VTVARLSFEQAVAALSSGEVVALPTDTVYGVGALLDDAHAVARLFVVKGRPRDVALPVLVGSLEDVAALGVDWPLGAQRLAQAYWPGAMTIVVRADDQLAARVGATDSVGVRWPRHEVLTALLHRCGPLAMTSANEHGRPPCASALDVDASTWGAPLAGVLDAGVCDGAVSSVVEVREDQWWLRREGAIERGAIEAILGPETPRDER
jgi:tRNA threonylcarbamoyl adenosine modification protein (Sua5/YciO/YrdC/YwlC family)